MPDPGLMVNASQVQSPADVERREATSPVFELVLKRRRCRWRGWYTVYHAPPAFPVRPGKACGAAADTGGYACFKRRRNAGTSIASAAATSLSA